MKSAKVKGFDPQSKYFYDVAVAESKSLLPSRVLKMCADLQDYDYVGIVVTSITGTVEKAGDGYQLTARGSKQKYALKANDALKKLVDGGKTSLTLAGKLTEPNSDGGKSVPPILEVSEVKESK